MQYNKCSTVHRQIEANQNHNRPQGIAAFAVDLTRFDFFFRIKNSLLLVFFPRHSNGCTDDGEDQPDDGRSLSRSASENSVAQHERNNNSTNNESINGYEQFYSQLGIHYCYHEILDRKTSALNCQS